MYANWLNELVYFTTFFSFYSCRPFSLWLVLHSIANFSFFLTMGIPEGIYCAIDHNVYSLTQFKYYAYSYTEVWTQDLDSLFITLFSYKIDHWDFVCLQWVYRSADVVLWIFPRLLSIWTLSYTIIYFWTYLWLSSMSIGRLNVII